MRQDSAEAQKQRWVGSSEKRLPYYSWWLELLKAQKSEQVIARIWEQEGMACLGDFFFFLFILFVFSRQDPTM